MILGYGLTVLALVATALAGVLFVLAQKNKSLMRPAYGAVGVATLGVFGMAGYLIYLLATHQFQVEYVAEYSAKRAASKYLFAAFWGGQQGSILLWAFWTALFGGLLAWKGGGKQAKAWPIFAVVQVFLMALLLMKSPFKLGSGPVPLDGKGLNPLLENPWMVIHPPILFLGFSSLVIPYVWTVYGVLYKDWDGWIKRAFPWTLFSFASLGFGIALGGYWAYETLGWGGFWAWDPVENTSIVPWLFVVALLHGIAIQRANGGYKFSNLLLGGLPFAFMVYGTFLTRTGVLEGFSVHTFSSLGKDGFAMLLGGIIAFTGFPLLLLGLRAKQIPKPVAYEKVATREFGFFLASMLLGLMGLITAVGMSAPLLTKLVMKDGAAAQPDFYNRSTFPLAILMTIGMAATPYFAWRATKVADVFKRLGPAYAGAVLLTILAVGVGMRGEGMKSLWMALLFAASIFAVLANLLLVVPRLKKREARRTVGGYLAHAGAAMILAGVACLVAFTKTDRVGLVINQPTEALGYKLTYLGMSSQPFDRENSLRIKVEKNARTWEANPHLFLAAYGGDNMRFANPPAIFPNIYNVKSVSELLPWNNPFHWGDLYIAHNQGPASTNNDSPNQQFAVTKGDEKTMGDYHFKFYGLQWSDEVREKLAKGPEGLKELPQLEISAIVDVTYQGQTVSANPKMILSNQGGLLQTIPAKIPGAENAILSMDEPNFPFGAKLSVTNAVDPGEMILIDVSTKPMIGLIWTGTLLFTIGGLIAYRRRATELGLLGDDEPAPSPAPSTEKREAERRRRQTGRQPARPQPARASATRDSV